MNWKHQHPQISLLKHHHFKLKQADVVKLLGILLSGNFCFAAQASSVYSQSAVKATLLFCFIQYTYQYQ